MCDNNYFVILLQYYGNYSVAAVVYDLMCLDCWNDKLIEFVFSEDFGELTTKGNMLFLLLNRILSNSKR